MAFNSKTLDIYSYNAIRFLYILFVLFNVLCFTHAIIYNKYNGDFLGSEVGLPMEMLLLNLVFAVLPFLFIWKLYLYFRKKRNTSRIGVPIKAFFFVIIWNIIITLLFGVGIAGSAFYQAPAFITPIIQISNRFNVFLGVYIYILATPKKSKLQVILIILVIFLSYTRASLGVFMFLAFVLLIKYFKEINLFYSKHKITVILLMVLSIPSIKLLFDIRDVVRGQETEEISIGEFIFGKLAGRFSSFSNSAIILENTPYFLLRSSELDDYYFQLQALSGVLGGSFVPSLLPETILVQLNAPNYTENTTTYMAGINGDLYISVMKSVQIFLYNLATYIFLIIMVFIVCRRISFAYSNEYAFFLLLYLVTSGVPNELSSCVFSILLFYIVFMILYGLKNVSALKYSKST